MTTTARDVEIAAAALQGHVVRTPLVPSPRLSEQLGCELWLKLETMQFTGSFKDRGACNKLQLLHRSGETGGVIAASAGNHAQGVAHHGRRLGIPATIVMPQSTPFSKVERTEGLGATVVLHGESLSEAQEHALELGQARGLTFVHPYDDEAIIAGQGTVAVEMLADRPDLEVLVVPIGGGGLLSGIALWARHVAPRIRIVGVQTEACPAMHAVLRGEREPALRTNTLADGIAVKRPGMLTREILARTIDEIVLVDENAIENAVHVLAAQQKVVAEGAGAAGFAAVLARPEAFAGKRVGVVICGGNIDRRMLSTVLLRGLKRDGKAARLHIEIHDAPGVLSKVTRLIGESGADIIDITHQRMFSRLPPRYAELDIVLETRGQEHVAQILGALAGAGFPARLS